MIEHESKVRVKMSFYIDVGTLSHPEDISEVEMKEIITENSGDFLSSICEHSQDISLHIDDYEFEDIQTLKEYEVTVSRTATRVAVIKVTAKDEDQAQELAMEDAGNIEFSSEVDVEYEPESVQIVK
jgi:hypothetical protein